MSRFQKATKKQARLRLALVGPSGSGKTWSALDLATHLGKRVALIDTERGSASKYADRFAFSVVELENFAPRDCVEALADAEREGFDVIIVDSLSLFWSGKGGALEMVDNAAARSRGNSYVAWRDVTPEQTRMVDAILASKAHIIVTLRAKTEYVLETDSRGKQTPRKVGMAPIQRDGLEYEFDLVADLDTDNRLMVSKSRIPALSGHVSQRQTAAVADMLRAWLEDGAEPTQRRSEPPQPAKASVAARVEATRSNEELNALWTSCLASGEILPEHRKAAGEMFATQRARLNKEAAKRAAEMAKDAEGGEAAQ